MAFVDTTNCYHRTIIIIDRFDDGSQKLVKNEVMYEQPPCVGGGCRACDYEQDACEFDPKTGLCGGRLA